MRTRNGSRVERRAQLLDATVRVIRSSGTAVSMDRIAAEAGITKPILYRHFGDRAGLVQALGERFADRLRAELANALASGRPAREVVEATIDAYLRVIEDDPDVYRFIVQRVAVEQPSAAARVVDFVRQVSDMVAAVLREQLRAAALAPDLAEPTASALVGMVHAAGDWWAESPTVPRSRLVAQLTTLVWGGLEAIGLSADAPAGPAPSGASSHPAPRKEAS